MKSIHQLTLAAAISAACATPAIAEEASSIAEALKGGDVTLSLRMRYEDVTVTNANAKDGTADLLSLRTRLTYVSQDFNGFGLGLEVDDVSHLQDYEPEGAVVSDPEGTEVNQYYLSYKVAKTTTKYGRQRILIDNQRFVGGVGFRQNEQTYDSFTVASTDIDKLNLFGAYVTNVNRIFGELDTTAAKRDNHGAIILLNAKYSFDPAINLTGYYYDIDNETIASFSTSTMGVRATGKAAGFTYEAEIATQSDSGDNPAEYSAGYLSANLSYAFKPVTISGGYESLGVDEDKGAFITPLATLHKFQGWTDVFLGGGSGNVAGGINDLFFKVAGKAGPVKLAAVYHQFDVNDSDQTGFDSFGSEIGFVVSGKVKGVGLSLKYAEFSADEKAAGYKNTQKLWLTAAASF